MLSAVRHGFQVTGGNSSIGMIRPKTLLKNGQSAAHEGFGLIQPVGGFQQLGQVVEADGDVGMIGVEGMLVNDQSAAHEGFAVGSWARASRYCLGLRVPP